jgi:hypothetical protein
MLDPKYIGVVLVKTAAWDIAAAVPELLKN